MVKALGTAVAWDTADRHTSAPSFRSSHFSPAPAQWKKTTWYSSSTAWFTGTA